MALPNWTALGAKRARSVLACPGFERLKRRGGGPELGPWRSEFRVGVGQETDVQAARSHLLKVAEAGKFLVVEADGLRNVANFEVGEVDVEQFLEEGGHDIGVVHGLPELA